MAGARGRRRAPAAAGSRHTSLRAASLGCRGRWSIWWEGKTQKTCGQNRHSREFLRVGGMAARYHSGYLISRRRGALSHAEALATGETPSPRINPHPKPCLSAAGWPLPRTREPIPVHRRTRRFLVTVVT